MGVVAVVVVVVLKVAVRRQRDWGSSSGSGYGYLVGGLAGVDLLRIVLGIFVRIEW